MSENMKTNAAGKPVTVVVGATSKWQSDGRNTKLAHGTFLDDSDIPVGVRWGVGGAVAQKFAAEGFFTVLTTRTTSNAAGLSDAIQEQGGDCMIVELDLVSKESVSNAFATIRDKAGDPDVLIYNAGYLEGRDLPPERSCSSISKWRCSIPRSISRAVDPSLSPRKCCRRCGRRGGHVPLLEQQQIAAWPQALHGQIALLSARHDANIGAGAYGGIFRAWYPCGECRDRRSDRLAGHAHVAESARQPGYRYEPSEDCGGVLLSPHTGQVLLDARATADAAPDHAGLLGLRRAFQLVAEVAMRSAAHNRLSAGEFDIRIVSDTEIAVALARQ